jgi:hypothetical protein
VGKLKTLSSAIFSLVLATVSFARMALQGAESPTPVSSTSSLGSLPYSNQWVYEAPQSYLYITANNGNLASSTLAIKNFRSDFGGESFWYPALDYVTRLFSFGSLEGDSFLRYISVRSRYGIGLITLSGKLSDSQTALTSAENSSMLGLALRLGPQVSFERWKFMTPYIGAEVTLLGYRHNATLNGAESQGISTLLAPTAGLQFHLWERIGVIAEARYDFKVQDSEGLFAGGTHYALGAGLVF